MGAPPPIVTEPSGGRAPLKASDLTESHRKMARSAGIQLSDFAKALDRIKPGEAVILED